MALRRFRRNYQPRSRWRQFFDWALTILLFALIALVIVRLEQFSMQKPAGVPGVADGDTLVFNGAKVRMEGIDAPEFTQVCQREGRSFLCGREARSQLLKLISGRTVSCKGWQADKYNRLLVTCTAGSTDLNREMVRTGWAVAYGNYEGEEAEARAAARGLWQGTFERPSRYREHKADIAVAGETPHDFWFKVWQVLSKLFGV